MQIDFSNGTPVPKSHSSADFGPLDPGNGLTGLSPVCHNPEDLGHGNVNVIYCRYSSDMQRKATIENQERTCRDRLSQVKLDHLAFVVITDEEISGTRADRPGWDRVWKLITNRCLGLIIVFEQSRMDRGDNAVNLVRDIVYHGGRYLSATEGIDTAAEEWEHLVRMASMQASGSSTFTARRVYMGQEGRVRTPDGSVGDHPYGYRSEFVAPEAERAASRQRNHDKRVLIDAAAAEVIRKIFDWFNGGLRIAAIVRELVALGDAIPGRSRGKGAWHDYIVRRILGNKKYVGTWEWGKTKVIRNSRGEVRQVAADPNRVVCQERPHLAIVSPEVFEKAQTLLAEYKQTYGAKAGGKKRGPKIDFRILHANSLTGGLIFCGTCGAKLQVSGSSNGVVRTGCPNHHEQGTCAQSVRVKAKLAEAEVTRAVRDALLSIPPLLPAIMAQMKQAVAVAAKGVPDERDRLEKAKAGVDQQVDALTEAVALGTGIEALVNKLRELEAQQKVLKARLKELPVRVDLQTLPTETEVARELENLAAVLPHGDPALLLALRRAIGRIDAVAVVAPGKKRGYIVLRLTIDLPGVVDALLRERLNVGITLPAAAAADGRVTLEIPLGEPTGPDRQAAQIYAWRHQSPRLTWSQISARTSPKLTIATCQITYTRYAAWLDSQDGTPPAAA